MAGAKDEKAISLPIHRDVKEESLGDDDFVCVPDCTGELGGSWTQLMIVVEWLGKQAPKKEIRL